MIFLNILVVMTLVVANGFFVAAEFALVKVRTGELKALADAGSKKALRALSIQRNLDTYLSSCQLGITLASLGLGWVGEPMVARSLAPLLHALDIPESWNHIIAFPIAFTAITFLHITLGEQVPKIYAISKFNSVSLLVANPLFLFTKLLKPFIWALNSLSNVMLRAIGFDTSELHGSATTEAELRLLLIESKEGGHVTHKEHKMIVNVLDLDKKFARRYAVPRHTIAYLDINEPIQGNLQIIADSKHTRLPVCDGDLEKCVGVVHVKDLFQQLAANDAINDLKSFMRPISILPEKIGLEALLAHFQKKKEHLALLVDEFGSISGMITIENVLEELVGAIQDEFDEEIGAISLLNDNEAEAQGTCPIDHLSRTFNIKSRKTTADTLGGYLAEIAKRILKPGQSISDGELTYTVLEASKSMIQKVKIVRGKPGEAEVRDSVAK